MAMKRMTIRNSDCTVSQPTNLNWENVLYRLDAYEDTGLEPEEIYEVRFLIAAQRDPQKLSRLSDLVLADQEGRLVVLPCKVGDTVYTTHWWKDVKEKCTDSKGKPFYRTVHKNIIKKERFYPFGPDYKWLGKTVFLTREEADAALAGKGGAK